jgi:hypothetical protein
VSALVAACGGGASTKKKPVETPPGPPAKTIAVLDKNPTPAGIPVGVTCQVVDAAGTAVQALTVVDPVADLEVAGFQVGSKKVGTYPITCSMPEVQGQYEKVAAPLEVKPGDPATIEVWATPDYKNYAIDTVITIAWKVLDAFGNEVPGLPATTTVDPDKGLFFEDGHYTFIVEGKYTVTVTLDAPHQAVSGSIELLCDQKGPEITVLFPARGETFAGDGKVTVKGSVKDLYSDVKKLKLNGADVTLDKDGAFEHPVQSLHGINVIVLTATDDRGNESKTTRGWYYSTA